MWLQLFPNRASGIHSLSWLLLAVLAFGSVKASAVQDESRAVDDKSAYYHFSMGTAYHLDGEYEKAISEFELALQADPGNPYLMSRFADTLIKAGYITRAVEMKRKAADLGRDDPALWYDLARTFFDFRAQENMRLQAEEFLERTLELEPTHNGALLDLGQIYLETGRWEDVVRIYSKLRQLDPTLVRPYLGEAQALERLGRLAEAADVLIAGLNTGNRIPDYLMLLGNYLEQLDRNEKAAEIYRSGIEVSPESQQVQFKQRLAFLYNRMEEYGKALPLLRELDGTLPPQYVIIKVELARNLRNTGNLEEARKVLEKALIIAPDNVQANYELSVVLALTGERERSIEVLEHLLSLDKEETREFRDHFQTRLSLLYRDEGQYDKSIAALQEVIERNPDNIDSRLMLLQTYRQAGMDREADNLSNELLKEHPGNPYVIIGRGQTLVSRGKVSEGVRFLKSRARSDIDEEGRDMIYMVLAQILTDDEQYEEAHRILREGLSFTPGSEKLEFLKASVFERQGNYDEAEKIFRRLLDKSPDDTSILNYLGYMLVDNDLKLDEAGRMLEKAVSLEPYNGAYQDSLGWLYFKQGRYEEAERHLLKASRLQKSDPVILEHLGDLYVRMGDMETARSYYRQSMSLAETGEESRRIQKKLQDAQRREK